MPYIFSNILGAFAFNDDLHLIDKVLFRNNYGSNDKDNAIGILKSKYKGIREPEEKELGEILSYFKKKEFFPDFYKHNMNVTKEGLRNSVKDDLLIIQAIGSIGDLDKAIDML